MTGLLIAFGSTAAVLWVSVFGYLAALRCAARWRRPAGSPSVAVPEIAVVIPVLNEERLILAKLADLRHTAYPASRLHVLVVDGGSTDGTPRLVEEYAAAGNAVRLLRAPEARAKSEQIARAFEALPQEIVVVTDADTRLDANCIPELVRLLELDPRTAIAGAVVRPETSLVEEHAHWQFLNHLWWLEGEALSAAVVSGACYAARRALLAPVAEEARAEDAHLALAASGRGFRVRICRTARATELRVPRSAAELIRFRRRRGSRYLHELVHATPPPGAPLGCRFARRVRLWHFRVTPKMGAGLAAMGAVLLCTPHWPWAAIALAAFATPALALLADTGETGARGPAVLAAVRLVALTWFALMTLRAAPAAPARASDAR